MQSKKQSANTESGREILRENIDVISAIEKAKIESRTKAEHVADKVITFAGGTGFIIFHIIWFTVWIVWNENLIPGLKAFDPYPFGFLTLVVSLEAIFLSLLVLMSQNRMSRDADKRALLDLQINMLAEQESTQTLRLVQKIAAKLDIQDAAPTADDLCVDTDIQELARKLDES